MYTTNEIDLKDSIRTKDDGVLNFGYNFKMYLELIKERKQTLNYLNNKLKIILK